jgi:hypothetical protein
MFGRFWRPILDKMDFGPRHFEIARKSVGGKGHKERDEERVLQNTRHRRNRESGADAKALRHKEEWTADIADGTDGMGLCLVYIVRALVVCVGAKRKSGRADVSHL